MGACVRILTVFFAIVQMARQKDREQWRKLWQPFTRCLNGSRAQQSPRKKPGAKAGLKIGSVGAERVRQRS